MKHKLILSLTVAAIVSIPATSVFAWGTATHSYFAHELGNEFGVMNRHEIYGSVLPDMFNLLFDYPHQEYLWTQTHYQFMKLVDIANFGKPKALAYGFAGHNEQWAADYTAHIAALTIDANEGYVIAKRKILAPLLTQPIEAILIANNVPYTEELVEELALLIADTAVETAVDILVSRNEDKAVGIRTFLAAESRGEFVPVLLCTAYAKDFAEEAQIAPVEAWTIMLQTEKIFREYVKIYSIVLMQDNPLNLMAEVGAVLIEAKLEKEYGLEVAVPPQFIENCLMAAADIVKDDYSEELTATLDFVQQQLEDNGVETFSW
ncbi:MAG: hypothetical protein ACYS4W_02660 [Planctomycetota bacterium]|jgi:hypothetical protein